MKKMPAIAVVLLAAIAACGKTYAQQMNVLDEGAVDVLMRAAFPKSRGEWLSRLKGDETMRACSNSKGAPSAEAGRAIGARERATIRYPSDGKLMGDWRRGEQLAQSGYGLRFTDDPATRATGGNCYACHQLTKQEVSFGTLGPSLLEYGKIRGFSEAAAKTVYEKIYNPQATAPCSLMPRFGANAVLTIDQIKDIVALIMSPESPVNRP